MKMKGKETENRMKIRNLQVNHLTKPVGISGKNLRLSWNLEGGKKQNGFEVTVQDTEGNVLEIVEEESNTMVCILKKEIPSRTKVKICVKVWDEEKKESEPAGITVVTGINQESKLLFRTKHGLQPRMVRLEKMTLWQEKYMMPGKNSRWNMV